MDINDLLPREPIVNDEIPWSHYQRDIFHHFASDSNNLIIEAVAGSGKSTTNEEGVNRTLISNPCEIIMLAFNKSIASAMSATAPMGVEARTFHSLGLSTFPTRPKVSGYKLRSILKDIIPGQFYEDSVRDVIRMISLAKANAIIDPDVSTWLATLDDYDINCDAKMEDRYCQWAHKGFLASIRDKRQIDFDDMLYLPIYYSFNFYEYDLVVVDEAQDLSPIQHEIVERIIRPGGRVIAVGDTNQAIYGFRGADRNSMNRFRRQFNTTELPLSICYRCPSLVVDQAKQIVSHIEARPNAPLGTVEHLDRLPKGIKEFSKKDLIVCRNNAPLFRLGMKFIHERQPVSVRGNFGQQLISFVKNFKTDNIDVFRIRLDRWHEVEYNRLVEADKFSKAAVVTDKYESIKAIADEVDTVERLIDILNSLFESERGTVLSSIHRAKGSQAPHVIFYKASLIPSRFARSEAAQQQEMNLRYVGITRAQETLTFVEES